jgi:serine-type D-Ala-D-Ala carboxypeptidase/endopeptidase (penicillin-binding protein 4)
MTNRPIIIVTTTTHRRAVEGMRLAGAILFCAALFITPLAGQPAQAVKALVSAIDAELRAPVFKRTLCAVLVRNAATGAVLYERNADLLLRPASNTKLVTSGAALLALSDTFRFVTRCFVRPIAPGNTELWIKGAGDPLFSTHDLISLVEQLRAAGLRNIAAVHLDASIFDSTYYGEGWMWDDETDATIPYIGAFPFERNRLDVTVTGAERVGQKAQVRVTPACEGIAVRNLALTGVNENLSVTRQPRSNLLRVWGTVRKNDTAKETVSMWNPAELLVCAFRREASARGLLAAECAFDTQETPAGAAEMARVDRTLDEVLLVLNKQSDNLCAESVLKTIGAAMGQLPGSAAGGLEKMERIFAARGVDTGAVALVDGSGISYYNLITPRALSDILGVLYHSTCAERYLRSLAVPGGEGTLKSRLKDAAWSQHVHAKTGTIRGVSTLSGYVTIPDATPLSFVIFMQNFTGPHRPFREIQDRIVRRCLECSAPRNGPTPSR